MRGQSCIPGGIAAHKFLNGGQLLVNCGCCTLIWFASSSTKSRRFPSVRSTWIAPTTGRPALKVESTTLSGFETDTGPICLRWMLSSKDGKSSPWWTTSVCYPTWEISHLETVEHKIIVSAGSLWPKASSTY